MSISSLSKPPGRSSRRNSIRASKAICIGGAACALLIWRKPTWIGRKTTNRAIGTEPVGIGTRIMALTPSFQGMESSTAHSVGVFIHRLTWALRRFSSSATATMLLIETFVTLTVGSTVTGSALAIGGTVIGNTLPTGGMVVMVSIMKLTTTTTSIMASTTDLAIPTTSAFSPFSTPACSWRRASTADSMKAKDSMEDILAKDSMEEAALSARQQWEALTLEAVLLALPQ